VVRGLAGYEGRSSLRSWIFSILLNRARSAGGRDRRVLTFTSLWRADRAAAVSHEQFFSGRGPGAGRWLTPVVPWPELPEERLLAAESIDRINALINALPPRQREAVIARDVLGPSAAEAAALSEQSESTHRVFLHRGRHAVRVSLARLLDDTRDQGPAPDMPRARGSEYRVRRRRAEPARGPAVREAPRRLH
jgi:RNA polymerase sigma-70 factor (ECF subfamily)